MFDVIFKFKLSLGRCTHCTLTLCFVWDELVFIELYLKYLKYLLIFYSFNNWFYFYLYGLTIFKKMSRKQVNDKLEVPSIVIDARNNKQYRRGKLLGRVSDPLYIDSAYVMR